jgi:hypothetical protein
MRRFVVLAVLVVGSSLAGSAPVAAQEEVKVVDHLTKKESLVKGAIDSESPEGIKIKVGTDVKLIPAVDIKHVVYKLGTVKGYEYNGPFTKETKALDPAAKLADRQKLLADARAEFELLAPRLANTPNAARFIQFKVLQIAALQAKEDPIQLDPTIKLLQAFKTEHDKGWELVPALKLLAEMQESKGDVADAKQTYLELTKIANLPKETKQEADLLVAQLSLRTGEFDKAEKSLDALRAELSPNDPQRPFVLMYLAQCQMAMNKLNDVESHLRAALASSAEPEVKCQAHTALGDFYRKKNLNEEAFWEYLRVDALYSQNRNEHAKALYFLSKLFAEVKKDKVKSQEYLEKLKLLDGTEYAKKAATEK